MPISTASLKELTIIQDLDKFLPELRLRVLDNSGALTHLVPFDQDMSKIHIELAQTLDGTDKNAFTFDGYRRQPGGDQSTPATVYDVSGLGTVDQLFTPSFSRGFSGNLRTTLQNLAIDELRVDKADVALSLDYDLTILQPTWNNIQFLNYLVKRLKGKHGEAGYRCNIQIQNYKKIFLFKSVSEMMAAPVSYKFILSDQQYQDMLPVYNYYIYDNYKLYGAFGNKQQTYTYFDWATGKFIYKVLKVQDMQSLADYFAIDKSDPDGDYGMQNSGRSNDFDGAFEGWAKNSYTNRLLDLVKIWITTKGIPNVAPGQTVQLFFPHGATEGNLYSYQYSGYWLVQKVVHNCGDMFVTKLLLTRHGWDTDKRTTLFPATLSKRF